MRGSGCPTAFCGSSGALVWLQTALMCFNYTHKENNNNESCNNNNINRVTVSQGKRTTRWPELSSNLNFICDSQVHLSWKWNLKVAKGSAMVEERVPGTGYRVPGTGNWDQGTWDRMSTHQMHVKVPLWKSQCESYHPHSLCPCACLARLAFGFFQRKRLTNLMQASFFSLLGFSFPKLNPFCTV